MGTCTRCGTPRTGAERCQFCGLSPALTPPPPPVPVPPQDTPASVPPPLAPAPWDLPPWEAPALPQTSLPSYAPSRTDGEDVLTVLWSAGRVLGAYLAVCVGLTTVLALALADGASNPLDWFRLGVLLAGLGLHGTAFASLTEGGDGGTLAWSFSPMLLLVGVLAAAYATGRQAERRDLSRDHNQALLRGLASAVAVTVPLALLALVCRFRGDLGLEDVVAVGSAQVGIRMVPLLLWGIPMLALAFAAGRSVTHRAVLDLPTLRDVLASWTSGVADWLLPAGLQVAVSSAVLAVVAFGYAVADDGTGDVANLTLVSVGGLVGYLLLSANIGLYVTALLMGIGFTGSGDLGGFGAGNQSFGLLRGDLEAGDIMWVVVPLLAALLAGARQAYRRPVAPWWHGGAASVVLWLGLLVLLRSSYTAGLGDEAFGISVRMELLTLVPCAFAYGCLLQLGGRAVADPLRRGAPGLARLLAYEPAASRRAVANAAAPLHLPHP